MDAIEAYIQTLTEPDKSALQHVTDLVRKVVPHAEIKVYYGVPSFLVNGKLFIGVAAGKKHMSLYPSGSGVEAIQADLEGYSLSKGTIRFTAQKPIPDHLINKLIAIRLAQIS